MSKILVTGSEGLIGKKICNYLKKKNQVFKLDAKKNINLCNEEDVKKYFKKNNNFDYLINLHGANEHIGLKENKSSYIKNDKELFNHFFYNNVFSIYLTNKYFIKYCKNARGILNFSSIYSLVAPKHKIYKEPKNIFYVSSKFAVNGLTKYFASMYGKKLNINTIACHGVAWKQPSNFKKKLIQHIPKNRMMNVEDLYGVMDLFCSKKNKFINGSTIIIDGGYTAW